MKPDCWARLGLESPARKFISENAMAAFELRDQVRSCKAWRVKSVEQIDDDFMMIVVIPLVLDNPMIASDGALLSWNDGYKDRRGPKRPSSQTEGEIALSYLQKRVLELSYQIEKMGALDVADGRGCGLITELRDIQGKYKTIALDVSRQLFFKERLKDAALYIEYLRQCRNSQRQGYLAQRWMSNRSGSNCWRLAGVLSHVVCIQLQGR
ncbi:hypothetical protein A9R10_08165 [Aeromonas piscicola]|nr:hypothetical protein A9R10_08165 [Aeromonas piscicola]